MSIKIQYSFALYIFVLLFFNLIMYFIPFFISILIHELIHGLFGVVYGLSIKDINIGINGLSINFNEFNISLSKKIIVLLSGPVSNLILSMSLIILNKEKYIFLIIVNTVLFIINIMPIYPLDGGKIINEIFSNYDKNGKIVKKIYSFFTILIILVTAYICVNYNNIQLFIIGIYLLNLSNKNIYYNVIII